MSCRCAGIALLLLAVVARPAAGQVKLEWKFQERDKFSARIVMSCKGKVVLNGETRDQEAENNTVLGFTVLKKTGASFVLEEKIQSVKVTSTGGSTGFPQIPLASKWRGARFTITLAPHGEISRFDGYESALKHIAGENDTVIKRMRTLFPEDSLKQLTAAIFAVLPKKEVKKGDTWERPMKVYLPPWGTLEAAARFVAEGKGKEGEKILMTAALKFVASAAKDGEPPFKIVSGQLKAEPARGTILFDPAAGRLIRSETKFHFKGALVFTSDDTKTTIRLEQEQTVAIRLQN